MKKVAIIGAGDLGKQLATHINSDGTYEVVGFFDDFSEIGASLNNISVLGTINQIQEYFDQAYFDGILLGIGYKHMQAREDLFIELSNNIPFFSFIHSSAFIHSTASVGAGCVILPGCIIDINVRIGNNVFLYNGCNISHDCQIKSHSFFGPGVSLAGFSKVGKKCFIGIGTILLDNLKIMDGISTGGGAVVTKSLFEPGVYIGVPAKKKI